MNKYRKSITSVLAELAQNFIIVLSLHARDIKEEPCGVNI